MTPDEQVFREHISQGVFQSGIDRDRWRLISIEWPYVIISVTAAQRNHGPLEYTLRFECDNYPQTPPTAQPWDLKNRKPLPHNQWPSGRSRVPSVFNPGWKGGQALYLPCDRIAVEGHDAWRNKYPDMLWSPTGDITQYLGIIYELLNSYDYTGSRCP